MKGKSWLLLLTLLVLVACNKIVEPDPVIPDQSFTEDFDLADDAAGRGWAFLNTSQSLGPTKWSNPPVPPFAPFSTSGPLNGYLWADFNSTTSEKGVISNWAVSPPLILQNGDQIIFHTRAEIVFFETDSTDFVNRLQVCLNTKNDGLAVGAGRDPGDFNLVLLDINPGYNEFKYLEWENRDPAARSAYPHRWTRFVATVRGLMEPVNGRFAFRYFVEEAGTNGRATSIGIDKVEYRSQP